MKRLGVFSACFLTGWTAMCLFMTYQVIFREEYGPLLVLGPFWFFDVFALGYVVWLFAGTTTFLFRQDRLVAERALWRYRRRREFLKDEILLVRQVKDGGEGDDTFPSWGLAVEGPRLVKILSHQTIDKSNWLGPIVAQWAEVEYVPWSEKKYEEL